MKIQTAKLVYFSPTRTTKTVLEGIARGLSVETCEHVDLTPPDANLSGFHTLHDELALIGAPVYGGRVPVDAVNRFRRVKANGTPAAIVVVYGNREYEDALLELRDIAVESGFTPVAGGAFVGEHSFSSDAKPIADGRPDTDDLAKAGAFGKSIWEKVCGIDAPDRSSSLQVPGNFPYKERRPPGKISPVTLETLCTACGTCASVCPTAAIVVDETASETVVTNAEACIFCCACVKNCPTRARVVDAPRIKEITEWLYSNYSDRKEPETFV